jgi:hypothetical protein
MNAIENPLEEIEQLNTQTEQFLERDYRREKVWELKSRGYSYREILAELEGKDPLMRISLGTIAADLKAKKQEIDLAYRDFIDSDLPEQHSLALTNLQAINKNAWQIFESAKDEKIKLHALHTAKEAQAAISDLMTSPEAIARAIRVIKKLKEGLPVQ